MNNKITLIIFLLISLGFHETFSQDYKETKEGIKYRFLTPAKDAKKVKENSFVQYHLTLEAGDTIWQSTYKTGVVIQQVKPNKSILDMTGVFTYVSEGDSIEAIQNLDSLRKVNPNLPEKLANVKEAKYTYKILKIFDTEEEIKEYEEEKIKEYIKLNNLKTKKTESGLYYSVLKENKKGRKAQKGDSIQVHYIGKFLSGKVFDTSREEVAKEAGIYTPQRDYSTGLVFPLGVGGVVKGWAEGFQLLREGEKAILLIPSHLGYGARGKGGIAPYTIMVFEVELISTNSNSKTAKTEENKSEEGSSYFPLLITLGIMIPLALILILLFRRPKKK